AAHLTAQHHKLMPKRHVLCFKADLRPEWRDQDREHEAYKRKHPVNLCDSLTSSTRIMFSVHTRNETATRSLRTLKNSYLSSNQVTVDSKLLTFNRQLISLN
ncbi:MAG: hypothetical protein WB689_19070, partial [Xanthobacteraceae bacterium]